MRISRKLPIFAAATVIVAMGAAGLIGAEIASKAPTRQALLVALSAILAATVLLSIWFSRSLSRPIEKLVDDMRALAGGDMSIDLHGKDRNDEIGDMVRSVASFRDAAIARREREQRAEDERARSEQERRDRDAERAGENARVRAAVDALGGGLRQLADGDLTARIDEPFAEDLEVLRHDFNASMEKLASALGEVRTNVVAINAASGDMREAFDDLSQRTERQAASLEETSAALDQVTATVKNSAARAAEANLMVTEARKTTDGSGRVVSDAVEAMGRIEQASGEISSIINVIDEIAFQTNLLALNAGVEAARAGEAGKGFAVVAQEVRELAQRAASAAQDIKKLITKSGEEVAGGVSLVRKTGEALGEISQRVAAVSDHIASIATAADEQSTGLQEINAAVNQMDQVTQQNAAMVERTTAITQRLSGEADKLGRLVARFRMAGLATEAEVRAELAAARSAAPVTPPASAGLVTARGPVAASARSVASESPARRIIHSVAKAFTGNGSAATSTRTTSTDDWEEF